MTFGLAPFKVPEQPLHEVDLSFLGGFYLSDGTAHLVSGPLLDLEVDSIEGETRYTYGPGVLDLTLTMANVDDVAGTFSAPTKTFSFVVCEGCDDLWGGGTAADFAIELGPGTFDARLAEFLHVSRHTAGGFIDFGLEDIEGGPSDDVRIGNDHRGLAYLEISGVEVPEPAPLIFALTAGIAWWSRRRS